jgi:hypothetical protein
MNLSAHADSRLCPRPGLFWLSLIICFMSIVPAFGQQPASKPPDHQGARGRRLSPAVKVAFKPGPFGPDGKVYLVKPEPMTSVPNETETPEIEEARALANAGIYTLTNKPRAFPLSQRQFSLLHWKPNSLNVGENPLMGSELIRPPVEPAAKRDKRILQSSTPQHGTDFPGIGQDGFIPPDGGVAAGPLQVIEVVNASINVYDKNGTSLSSQTLKDFFSRLGTPASDFIFDPSIYFDLLTHKFWVLAISEHDNPNRSSILVAVSNADDVTQGWQMYWLDATIDGNTATNNWCDYSHLGMDADAVYISCNQIAFPGPQGGQTQGGFQYAKVRIISWDEFTNNNCCIWWDITQLKEGSNNQSTSYRVRPALERFVGHGFGDYWVDAEGGGGSGNVLKVWQLQNPSACCDGSGGPTLVSTEQTVGTYGVAPSAAQPLNNGVSVAAIDTGNTSIQFAIYQFDHLSVGHTIACTQGGTTVDSCAAFVEMDTTNYPTITTINDWVLGQSAGEDVYYPFVDQNLNSDKTMVYTRSDGSSTYAGAYYITIPNSSTCTLCTGNEVTMQAGYATYVQLDNSSPRRNRWGDYHGAGTDPDLLGIWIEGEYASALNTWSTDVEPSYNSYFPIDTPSPTALSFGSQTVFSSAPTQNVTFTNTGNATMYITSTYISGDTDFFISSDGCNGATVQPSQSCIEGVSFFPTSVGNGNGFIVVLDNSPGVFADASLTGNGTQAASATLIGSSLNPSTYGQSVTFTAQVFSQTSGTPTGTVTFQDGATVLGTVTLNGSGIAQFTTAALSVGTHTIGAFYSGDTLFTASSQSMFQTVNPAPTSTAVVSSLNPSTYGTAVTFTATVSSGVGMPTGAVTFNDGTTTIGTSALSNGTASFTTAALSGGAHSITASYAGSVNFASSTSSALGQTVNPRTTATALASSANPSSYHQSVTFTAKVSSSAGVPQGTVTFKDGGVTLGTGVLNGSAVATLATNALTVGAHSVSAVYSGSANFQTSTSSAVAQSVKKATTTTKVTSSVNPSAYHQLVNLTATVVGAFGGVPQGTVTFKDGTITVGTATLNASGQAILSVNTLGVGAHSITASYAGNGSYLASVSATINQTVNKAATKTNLASSLNPSTHGTPVTFTATIVANFGGTATGKVTFKNGMTTLGTGIVNAGNQAKFTTSTLAVGTHSITAMYPGSGNFTASTSAVLKQVVK